METKKRNFLKKKREVRPKSTSHLFQNAGSDSTLKPHFKALELGFECMCFKEEKNATHVRTFVIFARKVL